MDSNESHESAQVVTTVGEEKKKISSSIKIDEEGSKKLATDCDHLQPAQVNAISEMDNIDKDKNKTIPNKCEIMITESERMMEKDASHNESNNSPDYRSDSGIMNKNHSILDRNQSVAESAIAKHGTPSRITSVNLEDHTTEVSSVNSLPTSSNSLRAMITSSPIEDKSKVSQVMSVNDLSPLARPSDSLESSSIQQISADTVDSSSISLSDTKTSHSDKTEPIDIVRNGTISAGKPFHLAMNKSVKKEKGERISRTRKPKCLVAMYESEVS